LKISFDISLGGDVDGEFSRIMEFISKNKSDHNRNGMARYGINVENAYGVSVAALRRMLKGIKRNHDLAQKLWDSGIHEARITATLLEEIQAVTPEQMDKWSAEIDSWDLCDQMCSNCFVHTQYAVEKAVEWSGSELTFRKHAGFVLIATLAVHYKPKNDALFREFLHLVIREAADERNFVKKAVNWALRQIGKRNHALRGEAIIISQELTKRKEKAAVWVGKNALRELMIPGLYVRDK